MSDPKSPWTLAIHGGAGAMAPGMFTPEHEDACHAGLESALAAGSAVLADGGSALDAVEAAVMVLEDNPLFNAGRGSVFTFEGRNEMDAAVMDGTTRSAGAIAGLTNTKNPVRAARAVMEKSPHVLLSHEGANRFSSEMGLEQADSEWFATAERRRQWEEFKERKTGWFDADLKYGTVGAVAVDASGHVAAATSTGGLTGKRWGRIGDSPVIGAGTYADDRACAVSATGTGEVFIRNAAAHEIAARMRLLGETAQQAVDAVMAEVGAMGGDGGVIFAAHDGSAGFAFNTPGMFRGRADASGLHETAIYGNQVRSRSIG
ncbi:isoaspartyl peptidase/L-asparaginase [Croceicoccus ponticola]|uniref:Isoaspartyl peptidase n=1 Tax=Croceicoccus ponticola TaxID=2217664 RepID=A0A437GYJ8_9SPHN|nr:isoaspartyl peptidase/L-asparaginase [Croceicoccus ponticola]RVQ67752.1 isoaspartyl peptidase/L-asparaginase [Croceicoccus ponticola]